jgi:catechol 2,3-dioxygenase-like lactoylglutathione lyase family enzyme
MAVYVHLAALFLLTTLPLSAQSAPASAPNANNAQTPATTVLGQGWGIDHVGVAVRDHAQAEHDYEQLGFKITGRKHFPDGVLDSHVYLQKNSYLELVWVNGSTSIKQGSMASVIAEFTQKGERAMFLGINVSSAAAAADYLTAHGFDVSRPHPGSSMEEGQTTLPPPMWYSVMFSHMPALKKGIILPIFFIEYVSTEWREKHRVAGDMDQPNTAIGIHAVWFAVHDTEAQLGTLRDAGFESGQSRDMKPLGADGREVKAGQGVLLLLQPSDKNGVLSKYLSDHTNWIDGYDEGVIGVSIEVADMGKARQLAESGTGRKLETYEGFYGKSFLLPPEVTHGVWIEMFQPAEH